MGCQLACVVLYNGYKILVCSTYPVDEARDRLFRHVGQIPQLENLWALLKQIFYIPVLDFIPVNKLLSTGPVSKNCPLDLILS